MKKLGIILLVIATGLLLGWLSARIMLNQADANGSPALGGWHASSVSGTGLLSIYESGHYLLSGKLPPPGHVRLFSRTVDDDGNQLRGDCVVVLEGTMPQARWWSVNAQGGGPAQGIAAGNAVEEAAGTVAITVSRNPMPGNWFAPATDGNYTLLLALQDLTADEDGGYKLPTVRRLWC